MLSKVSKINLGIVILFALAILVPDMAFAQTVGSKLCRIYACIVNSDMLIVIATLGIFFLGIGAFFGKVSWGLVIMVAIAISITVGAMELAVIVTGKTNCSVTTC